MRRFRMARRVDGLRSRPAARLIRIRLRLARLTERRLRLRQPATRIHTRRTSLLSLLRMPAQAQDTAHRSAAVKAIAKSHRAKDRLEPAGEAETPLARAQEQQGMEEGAARPVRVPARTG